MPLQQYQKRELSPSTHYCNKITVNVVIRLSDRIFNSYFCHSLLIDYISTGRYPVGSGTPQQLLLSRQLKLRLLNEDVKDVSLKTQQAIAKSRDLEVKSDFASFPAPQVAKVSDREGFNL